MTGGFVAFRGGGDNAGVSAVDPITRLAATPGSDPSERYATIYYPETTDEQAASPIDVAAGADVSGIDVSVDPIALQRVRGRVVYESSGEPSLSAKIQALTSSGAVVGTSDTELFGRMSERSVDPETGTFELSLAPGSYTIAAAVQNLVGRTPINVGYADLDNITVTLSGGFNVTGRVTIEGRQATPAELAVMRVSLVPSPIVPGAFLPYSVPIAGGALTLAAGRGDFRLSVAPLLTAPVGRPGPPPGPIPPSLQNSYVKSARLGDVDILVNGLHLEQQPQAPLLIVIGTTPGVIAGTVVNETRQGLANVTAVLLPDAARGARSDLVKWLSTDDSGRFRFEQIPPGDYRLFAWEDIEPGAWLDPDVMRAYDDRGWPVHVDDNGQHVVEVVAIK
jgi:hypothetical protein